MYCAVIDWQCTAISEPPVLQCISNAVTEKHIITKMPQQELLPMFPYLRQLVQLVTKASVCIVNSLKRDCYIMAQLNCNQERDIPFGNKEVVLVYANNGNGFIN